MTQGPFLKKVLVFAVPLMFTGLLQLLYNSADIAVVGRFVGKMPYLPKRAKNAKPAITVIATGCGF